MAFGNTLLNINEDIKFDLDQIRLSFQDKEHLTDEQKDKLKVLPKKLQEDRKAELLKEAKNKKKEEMRRWALQLEENVAMTDYPPEIKSRILGLTERMKYSRFTLSNDEVERQVSEIKRQIEAFEQQKALGLAPKQQENRVGEAVLAGAVGAVVAGAVLGPYIQVRYTEEGYRKLTNDYVENKVLAELRSGNIKQIPISKSYPKKTGAQYSSRHEVAEKELQDKIDKEVAKLAGVGVEDLEKLNPVKRRAAERYALDKNQALAQERKSVREDIAAGDILVGLLRQERRGKADALRTLEEQKEALMSAQTTPETKASVEAQLAAVNGRISEHRKEELAMALFVENLSKTSLEKRKTSLTAKKQLSNEEADELKQIQERLPKLNERLAMHRVEANALGLKVAGFEKTLEQRGVANTLLKSAQNKGNVSLTTLIDQVMILAQTGMPPITPTQSKGSKKVRVDGKKMKIALENGGLSGELKKEIQNARAIKKTTKGREKVVENTVATNRKEATAKTKSIRLRVNPHNEQERVAANQLQNVLSNRKAKGKQGIKEILKDASKNVSGIEPLSKEEWLAAAQKVPQRSPEEIRRMNEALQKELAKDGFKSILRENSSLVKSKQRVTEVPQRLLEEKIRYRDAG